MYHAVTIKLLYSVHIFCYVFLHPINGGFGIEFNS